MKAKIRDLFDDQEVEVDLEKHLGIAVGSRIKRTADNVEACLTTGSSKQAEMAADKSMGWARGVVLDLTYQGTSWTGANVFTAKVKWDNGETHSVGTALIESEVNT